MSGQLGPIEICCDAPLHAVVQACERLGFQSPLDVRWCRLCHFRREHGGQGGAHGGRLWEWLFRRSQPGARHCTCGEPLPALKPYCFTFDSEPVAEYLLGQCRRCRTMFWEVRITRLE